MNKGNWLRIDEIIGDKASKFDINQIKDKIKACLPIQQYNEYCEVQDEMNKALSKQNTSIIKEFEGNKTMLDFLSECNEKHKLDILMIQDANKTHASQKQIIEIIEMIQIKVDRFELNSLYEMKSNKTDLNVIISVLDKLHDQIKQTVNVIMSTAK